MILQFLYFLYILRTYVYTQVWLSQVVLPKTPVRYDNVIHYTMILHYCKLKRTFHLASVLLFLACLCERCAIADKDS